MGRSKFKLPFVHRSQISRFLNNDIKRRLRRNIYRHMLNKYVTVSPKFFFWKRSSLLSKRLVSKRICIYNGKIFHLINTNAKFKGFRLGEFSVSRKRPVHRGKQKQIKKIVKKIKRKKT